MQGMKGLVEMFLISSCEMSTLELADFLVERGFASFRAVGLLLPASLKFACFPLFGLGGCTGLGFLPSFLGEVDRGIKMDGGGLRADELDSEDDDADTDLRCDGLTIPDPGNGCAGPWVPQSNCNPSSRSNGCRASFLPVLLDVEDEGVVGAEADKDVGRKAAVGKGVANSAVADLLRTREGSGSLRSISMSVVRSSTWSSSVLANAFSSTWCTALGGAIAEAV